MREVFWLVPDRLGGRCGPDTVAWDLTELKTNGIEAILSVNQGTDCNPADFAKADIVYACISLSKNAPPEPGDLAHNLQALPLAYDFITQQLEQGHKVLIHCRSGKDRTGLLMAYFLIRSQGFTITAAIEQVMAVRPIALSAPGWAEFAPEVLSCAQADFEKDDIYPFERFERFEQG